MYPIMAWSSPFCYFLGVVMNPDVFQPLELLQLLVAHFLMLFNSTVFLLCSFCSQCLLQKGFILFVSGRSLYFMLSHGLNKFCFRNFEMFCFACITVSVSISSESTFLSQYFWVYFFQLYCQSFLPLLFFFFFSLSFDCVFVYFSFLSSFFSLFICSCSLISHPALYFLFCLGPLVGYQLCSWLTLFLHKLDCSVQWCCLLGHFLTIYSLFGSNLTFSSFDSLVIICFLSSVIFFLSLYIVVFHLVLSLLRC